MHHGSTNDCIIILFEEFQYYIGYVKFDEFWRTSSLLFDKHNAHDIITLPQIESDHI